MSDEMNTNPENENNAGVLGIIFSVLFPIVGVILYFAKKKSVSNPSAYLYGALCGFVVGLIIRFAQM